MKRQLLHGFKRLTQGFTLIELLVAISILAILATIAVMDFGHTRQTARDSVRKSDVNTVVDAIKLYGVSHTSYFIVKKGQTCDVINNTSSISATGDGCTGANGRSWGKLNFKGTLPSNSYNYGPYTILEVLKGDGFLGTDAKDPQYKLDPVQWDYTLVRCKTDWTQSFDKQDSSFAVWTSLETVQGTVDNDNTNRACGGSLAALRAGVSGYDFAFVPDVSPTVSTKSLAQVAVCYTVAALQTVDTSGSPTTTSGLEESPCNGGGTASTNGGSASPCSTQSTGIADVPRVYAVGGLPAPISPSPSSSVSLPPSPSPSLSPSPSSPPTPSPSNTSSCPPGSPTTSPSTSPSSSGLPFPTPSGSGSASPSTVPPTNSSPIPDPSPTFDVNGHPLYAGGNVRA